MMEQKESLLAQLQAFRPYNEQEQRDRELLLGWLRSGMDIVTRNNAAAHLTASAWVVSPDRSRVLMAYHNLYHSWAWLGGHADGDWDLRAVAGKEVAEESGMGALRLLTPEIFSLEILTVDGHEKHGHYVSSHLHLNVTYLFEADPTAPLRCKPDENSAVAWIDVADIPNQSTEPWFIKRIYAKLTEKVLMLEKPPEA